ncbi:glycosyltransferase [Flavivirga aquatica]|uniref:Glycosyltransferase n=1 Tax=Flavivirga aquatica TaxID=1849968 RepID=A0A1E5T917_9FLAO|nr:TIGR04282 family arsenosugar biosynthesis glycosyltransferase [Flavivirga aquatica]OEK07872.1 glycosyltransferase [Flavivirga aquatica]
MSENALIVFTRNPELGKCKTRLAKTVGDQTALDIYKFLLQHTADISKAVDTNRFVFYSENIIDNDIWDTKFFNKKLQKGEDLGERMQHAFTELLNANYNKVVIIGSDLYDLNAQTIEEAYKQLESHDVVIGPAEDGGYYLLGMNVLHPEAFKNKAWGTSSVLEKTLTDLNTTSVKFLDKKNDIDTWEDIKDIPFFVKNFLT